jgi:predicted Zn finger-like uncharacterized protein
MVVTCEVCNAKFRLDPERLKGPKSKVRCSRCGHVFTPVQEEEELVHVDLADDMEYATKAPLPPTPPPTPTQPSRIKEGRPWTRWLGWVALVLIVGLGGLGLMNYLGSHSEDKAVPALPETPLLKVLDSTQAFFLENAHAGQIFVVEGEVENQSAKPVSFILLEGKLYNTTNRVAITQKCFAGNAMTREELSRLNMAEVQNRMMNREGKTLSNVKIPSGKRVSFMLVFHNLPELKALSDYSVEVVSSKVD